MATLKGRICSMILSAALVASMCPALALAQGEPQEEGSTGADALSLIAGQIDLSPVTQSSDDEALGAADIELTTQASLNKSVLKRIDGWWHTWGQNPNPPMYKFHDGVADYYSPTNKTYGQDGKYVYTSTAQIKSITAIHDNSLGAGYDIDLGNQNHFRLYNSEPSLLYNYFGPNNTHSGTSSLVRLSSVDFPGISSASVKRLSGSKALDTMDAIVKQGSFKQGGIVVLATIDGYWDALTAAGVAGMANAPVLMTEGNVLSTATANQIKRLKPKTIVICGGPLAVSRTVEKQAINAAGGKATVKRCAGQNAVGTANEVFKQGEKASGGKWAASSKGAFICTSAGYWDALSAAPISYSMHMPIFLTNNANSISKVTIDAMKGKVSGVYIVGGETAISKNVERQLTNNGIKVYKRLWGATAVETSQAIADYFIPKFGLKANKAGFATVNGYWDALSGAALCGLNRSVLLLVSNQNSSTITDFAKNRASKINTAYIFGGNAAINSQTSKALSTWLSYGSAAQKAESYATSSANVKRKRNVDSTKAFIKYYYDRWDPPNKEKGLGTCPVKYTNSSGVGSRISQYRQYYYHFVSVNASATANNTVSYTALFESRRNWDSQAGAYNVKIYTETGTLTFNDSGQITSWTYKVV